MRGDADRLGQAIDNLVSNALKFTPAGGRVSVRLAETGDGIAVAVSDSGIGIPADEQERLFDRFFRASTATDRSIPGVGLGLTIVKAIVEGHGGVIGLTSAEGQGTTFHFTLPRTGAGADERSPVRALSMSGGHR